MYSIMYLTYLLFIFLQTFVFSIDLSVTPRSINSHSNSLPRKSLVITNDYFGQLVNIPRTVKPIHYIVSLYYIHNQSAYGPVTKIRIIPSFGTLSTDKAHVTHTFQLFPSNGDYRFYANNSIITVRTTIPPISIGTPLSSIESTSIQYLYVQNNDSITDSVYHSIMLNKAKGGGRLLQSQYIKADVPPGAHPYLIPQFDTVKIAKAAKSNNNPSASSFSNIFSNFSLTTIVITGLSIVFSLVLFVGLIMYLNYRRSQRFHSRYGTNPQGRGIKHILANNTKTKLFGTNLENRTIEPSQSSPIVQSQDSIINRSIITGTNIINDLTASSSS